MNALTATAAWSDLAPVAVPLTAVVVLVTWLGMRKARR